MNLFSCHISIKIIPLIWCWVVVAATWGGTGPRQLSITPGFCWERSRGLLPMVHTSGAPPREASREYLIQMPEPLQLTPLHVGERRLSAKLLLFCFLWEHPGGGIWDCQAGERENRQDSMYKENRTRNLRWANTNELTQRKPETQHSTILFIANYISSASILNLDSFIWNAQFCRQVTSSWSAVANVSHATLYYLSRLISWVRPGTDSFNKNKASIANPLPSIKLQPQTRCCARLKDQKDRFLERRVRYRV